MFKNNCIEANLNKKMDKSPGLLVIATRGKNISCLHRLKDIQKEFIKRIQKLFNF